MIVMGRRLNSPPKKIALFLIVFAFLFLPTIDALAKLLGDSISAGQIAWSRFLIQTILMCPIFFWGFRKYKTQKIFLQFMRGVLIACTTVGRSDSDLFYRTPACHHAIGNNFG